MDSTSPYNADKWAVGLQPGSSATGSLGYVPNYT